MASFRVARMMFSSAAEAAAPPGTASRWERLKNSKVGEELRHGLATLAG